MARRPSGIDRTTIQFRVEKSMKDRLAAVAFAARLDRSLTPSEINLSEFTRALVQDTIENYEREVSRHRGGVDGAAFLAAEYKLAVNKETQALAADVRAESEQAAAVALAQAQQAVEVDYEQAQESILGQAASMTDLPELDEFLDAQSRRQDGDTKVGG